MNNFNKSHNYILYFFLIAIATVAAVAADAMDENPAWQSTQFFSTGIYLSGESLQEIDIDLDTDMKIEDETAPVPVLSSEKSTWFYNQKLLIGPEALEKQRELLEAFINISQWAEPKEADKFVESLKELRDWETYIGVENNFTIVPFLLAMLPVFTKNIINLVESSQNDNNYETDIFDFCEPLLFGDHAGRSSSLYKQTREDIFNVWDERGFDIRLRALWFVITLLPPESPNIRLQAWLNIFLRNNHKIAKLKSALTELLLLKAQGLEFNLSISSVREIFMKPSSSGQKRYYKNSTSAPRREDSNSPGIVQRKQALRFYR